jgi:opacity protein-like surface antigen
MKKGFFSCLLIAALMLLLSAGSVFAAENANTGFYVGISGGYVIPSTLSITPKDSDTGQFDATLNNGFLVGVKGGWNAPFTNRIMALEMEYNYICNNFDNSKYIPQIDGTLDGTISVHALLFNVKARYPEGKFHPYAGAGLGWALVQVGDLTGTGGGVIKGDIGNAFCWQLLAGLDYDITPNIGLGIGYKYIASSPTIGSSNGGDKIYADVDYKASVVTLGLTYTF